MRKILYCFLGFVAAPLFPAAYFSIVYPISGNRDYVSILGTFALGYMFAVAGVVFLGVPIFFLLNRLKLIRWWSAVCAGAFVGVVLQLVITSGRSVDIDPLAMFALLGAIAGLVFWIFWRKANELSVAGSVPEK